VSYYIKVTQLKLASTIDNAPSTALQADAGLSCISGGAPGSGGAFMGAAPYPGAFNPSPMLLYVST